MRRVAIAMIGALVLLSACAPRSVVVAPASPAFPDFLFPAVPPSLGDAELMVRQQRAWNLLQSGDLSRSAQEFSGVLQRSPGFYPSESGLGYVELARRDPTAALARFDSALAAGAGYAPALVGRGQALLGLRRDDDALASFEAALAADPGLADVRQRVEVLKFRAIQDRVAGARRAAAAGQLDEARAAYERAIAASPDSSLLYRELAAVEQKRGNLDRALAHARRAVEVDRSDPRAWVQLGDLLELTGDLAGAIDALTAAAAAEPSTVLSERIAALRARAELDRLPAEYRAIASAGQVARGDLAALIGVKLPHVLRRASRQEGVVFTDGRDHWAAPWIQEVVRAGVMEIYANHTFQPEAVVLRNDLAQAVSRLLNLLARANPALGQRWQELRQPIADLAREHSSYPAASSAVASGVMPLLEGNTFRPTFPIGGAEAISAIDRLVALAATGGMSPGAR